MDCIGIKVAKTTSVVKCVAALRKHLPLPISEVKRRIVEGDYLYLGNFVVIEEVDLAIKINDALVESGIEVQCYEHTDYFAEDRPLSYEDLKNWSKTCHEIE